MVTCLLTGYQEYFISGFNVLLPTLAKDLDIPKASQTWPANAFSLVVACFLLTFGRLADMYGGWPVYVSGFVWLCVWSLIAGFSQNELMLDFGRAIQGFGPAAYLPASFMLLGSTYRPGPRKNIVFSIYGAAAPFGFYVGIFFAGKPSNRTKSRTMTDHAHQVSLHSLVPGVGSSSSVPLLRQSRL
jgi:MFS family permease